MANPIKFIGDTKPCDHSVGCFFRVLGIHDAFSGP